MGASALAQALQVRGGVHRTRLAARGPACGAWARRSPASLPMCSRPTTAHPSCLQRHYTRSLLPELYKVVGSASVFGDPVRLFHHLGLGVWSFLASPAAGMGSWRGGRAWERVPTGRGAPRAGPLARPTRPAPCPHAGLVESARQRGPRQFFSGVASGTRGLFQVCCPSQPALAGRPACYARPACYVRAHSSTPVPPPSLLPSARHPHAPRQQNWLFALSNAATKGSTAGRKAITALGLDRPMAHAGQPAGWPSSGVSFRRLQRFETDLGGGSGAAAQLAAEAVMAAGSSGEPGSPTAVMFSPREGLEGPQGGGGDGGVLGALLLGVAGLAREPVRGFDEGALPGAQVTDTAYASMCKSVRAPTPCLARSSSSAAPVPCPPCRRPAGPGGRHQARRVGRGGAAAGCPARNVCLHGRLDPPRRGRQQQRGLGAAPQVHGVVGVGCTACRLLIVHQHQRGVSHGCAWHL